ncbi:MAG: M3 family oligoendopeptidase [candidate division WOR-3 bacterium]|nr:MAG: M3 family oligoendopeptidase [candidate division WOR-3 bacterium]
MLDWKWPDFEPQFRDLASRRLTADTVEKFLTDWTWLHDRVSEVRNRLQVASWRNTADAKLGQRFDQFLRDILPKWHEEEQKLRTKLLESGLQPAGLELPLRRMRTDAALFREENLELEVEEERLHREYEQVSTARTVVWEGKEVPRAALWPVLGGPDRERREAAWRVRATRELEDRTAINSLWQRLLENRLKLAANAGSRSFRDYGWQLLKRFDYTPEDCKRFHRAVEQAAVPAAGRARERRRRMLGLDSLRPWDVHADVLFRPPLKPFADVGELKAGAARLFAHVDEDLGRYFQAMVDEDLLDLESRKNKVTYTCCVPFAAARQAFIMASREWESDNIVGGLAHEFGHACHVFEKSRLPWYQQRETGHEAGELASQSMELLVLSHLAKEQGGFHTEEEARRVATEHLEYVLRFLPRVAAVDALQHWAYENPKDAQDPDRMDEQWLGLMERFEPGVDWTGLEHVLKTGWWRDQSHILVDPLYYIDYGVGMVGACQVWANSMKDKAAAVSAYRQALALGGTKSLPELYRAAGAKFAFDADTLAEVVDLVESKLPGEPG